MQKKNEINHQEELIRWKTLADSSEYLVREWHPVKNLPLTPFDVLRSDVRPIHWQCQTCGHEFINSVKNRYYRQSKCPCCLARQRRQPLKMKNVEQSLGYLNPFLMREWHPTRNGDANAFELYPKSGIRVWWQCSDLNCQHAWQATVRQRVSQGSGCPACAKRRRSVGYLYPQLKQEWNPVKNQNIDLTALNRWSNREGVWTCQTCGEDYLAKIQDRIRRGVTCPSCESLKDVKARSRIYLIRSFKGSNRAYRMRYYQLKD